MYHVKQDDCPNPTSLSTWYDDGFSSQPSPPSTSSLAPASVLWCPSWFHYAVSPIVHPIIQFSIDCALCRGCSIPPRGIKLLTPHTFCDVLSEPYEGRQNCVVLFEDHDLVSFLLLLGHQFLWYLFQCSPVGMNRTDMATLLVFERAPQPKWIFSCLTMEEAEEWATKIRLAQRLCRAMFDRSHSEACLMSETWGGDEDRLNNPSSSCNDPEIQSRKDLSCTVFRLDADDAVENHCTS